MAETLGGKTALVTGATGFLGGRLLEKLVLEEGTRVRALVHDYGNAARVARLPVEMIHGGVSDAAVIDRATVGCDVVFHCAHDFSSTKVNLEGIRNVTEACLKNSVRRLVHVSTMAVYEPLPDADVTEDTPEQPNDWSYAVAKREAERRLLELFESRGLPVVILQPTIIYGPFSKAWTLAPVQSLLEGQLVLSSEGDGLCNAVYVDDVVDALILAAKREGVVGERFLISGPEPVSWNEFFGAYAKMLGTDSLTFMSEEEIRNRSQGSGLAVLRTLFSEPGNAVRRLERSPFLRSLIRNLYERLDPNLESPA